MNTVLNHMFPFIGRVLSVEIHPKSTRNANLCQIRNKIAEISQFCADFYLIILRNRREFAVTQSVPIWIGVSSVLSALKKGFPNCIKLNRQVFVFECVEADRTRLNDCFVDHVTLHHLPADRGRISWIEYVEVHMRQVWNISLRIESFSPSLCGSTMEKGGK